MAFDYFYDAQIRRFLMQVVRAFSGFQYQVNGRNGSPPELRIVPCTMATQNRQVGHILKNNSENSLLSVPKISVFIKETRIARERTQAPGHVSSVHVTERAIDDGRYTGERGTSYTVERMMPHPLNITIQVDVWTSNEHQKHQLFEQIYMAFNVGFDIQNSENPVDWTALTTMKLEEVTWSSRSIPIGTSDEIDVMSFTFELPVWISPPAKVKQQKLIEQIVTNILDGSPNDEDNDYPDGPKRGSYDGSSMGTVITTPGNAQIRISGDEITLLSDSGMETDQNGNVLSWKDFLEQYGKLEPAQSQLRLRAHIEQDLEFDVIGYIQLHGTKPNVLLWQVDVDTLPSNTLRPIDGVIDPLVNHPGNIPDALVEGRRYLILNDLGSSKAWNIQLPVGQKSPFAKTGDILEFKDGAWVVSFSAQNPTNEIEYVVNLKSGKQLKFEDGSWIMAIDGDYNPGYWRLYL